MSIVIGILIIIILILFIQLFYIKRQIKDVNRQLIDINQNKNDKKITISLVNKDIENLTKTINATINIGKQCESSKVKLQNDLKQTIANMSHDLRTPLTSIIGYIQFCKSEDIKEDDRNECLNMAEQRAKTLERLLNDFYELSLIESFDYKVNLEHLNLSRMLQEILLCKYMDFVNAGLNPNINIPNENIYIIAEEKSLERVIENLLSNAIKYAKGNIDVSLAKDNDTVLLKVSNVVTDLTSEDVEKMFDRFYIADKTRSGKGTGLGLSIVKALMEKMNGNVTADIIDNTLNIYCRFIC